MKRSALLLLLAIVALVASIFYFSETEGHLRGDALLTALKPTAQGPDAQRALVARAILDNYAETRRIAALWSGLYWGFAWIAAALGALAGLVLKLESFLPDDKIKKDVAALLTVTAAILVTVSTGGDFQRKWQANRTAAAEIEHIGYALLANTDLKPESYLLQVSEALLRRHMAILGTSDRRSFSPAAPASQAK